MAKRHWAVLACGAVVLLGCREGGSTPTLTRAGLDTLYATLDSAFRAGSSAAAVSQFSPDATISLINLADLHGREAFSGVLSPLFAQVVVREHRFTVQELEVYDSVAYERGAFTWSAAPRGQVAKVDHGRV